MNVTLRTPPRMTREEFFAWAEAREERYEFDGTAPVFVTGGSINHSQITQNILFALRSRLAGRGWRALGPDAGLATAGQAVRYPDVLVTGAKFAGTARLVPGVVVVFEVLSPTSGRTDRITKLREYAAVESLRRYVIVEQSSVGASVFHRASAEPAWTAIPLTGTDAIDLVELGVSLPMAELYFDVDFGDDAAD